MEESQCPLGARVNPVRFGGYGERQR